jgi:hypothetical protein
MVPATSRCFVCGINLLRCAVESRSKSAEKKCPNCGTQCVQRLFANRPEITLVDKAAGAASAGRPLGDPVVGLTHGRPRQGGQRYLTAGGCVQLLPTALGICRLILPIRANEARQ